MNHPFLTTTKVMLKCNASLTDLISVAIYENIPQRELSFASINHAREAQLPQRVYVSGPLARILFFVRPFNDRCPAEEFLNDLEPGMRKKFMGQFDALTKAGSDYCNNQRFIPLGGDGKPLWEFKEFDHRLYCRRTVVPPRSITVVLLSGWIKQKKGKSKHEDREVKRAQDLYVELQNEEGA